MSNTVPKTLNDGHTHILVIDMQPILRLGIRALAEREPRMSVVGEAETVEQAVRVLRERVVDLVIVDSSLGSRVSLDAVIRIRAEDKRLPILVISQNSETTWGVRMIRAGAQGYVLHSERLDDLQTAIRQLASGKPWISPAVRERVLSTVTGRVYDPIDSLSNRELEIFTRIGRGESTRSIATDLGISTKTVDSHRERIKNKMGLNGACDLIRRAVLFVERETARI